MKIRLLALAVASLSSVGVLAATTQSVDSRVVGLGETVAQLEWRYPGKVVAIELDASGDATPHYHIDMRFPESGLARLDVNAETLAIASREPAPLASGSAPLVYAAALVTSAVPGQLLIAQLDATNGVPAHYDIDVALPQGGVARLKVDAANTEITWRSPAIISD